MREITTREEWLTAMAKHLEIRFILKGYYFERDYKVSCGMPSKGMFNRSGKVIGECWNSQASTAGINEIFISPAKAESLEVAGILAHELIHAWDDCINGHRKQFSQCAAKIGLLGPFRSTRVGEGLTAYILKGIRSLGIGEYPHDELSASQEKQGSRMLKMSCVNSECSYFKTYRKPYILRLSYQVMQYAYPMCGACGIKMEEDF